MIEGRATSRPTAVIAATEILTDMRCVGGRGERRHGSQVVFAWERVVTAEV